MSDHHDQPDLDEQAERQAAAAADEASSADESTAEDVSTDAPPEEEPAAPEDRTGEQPDWETLAEMDERTPGQLLAALGDAARERDEYLDGLRRKQAEFENFRKRMMREGATQRIAGHADVAERLLDVLDDFDRTLDAAGEVEAGFLKGVQLVHDKLVTVLKDFGLARIDDVGQPFDPNRHEAVQQVAAEESRDEPVVAQVLRPGYELGGRVLRPAMVVVEQ